MELLDQVAIVVGAAGAEVRGEVDWSEVPVKEVPPLVVKVADVSGVVGARVLSTGGMSFRLSVNAGMSCRKLERLSSVVDAWTPPSSSDI